MRPVEPPDPPSTNATLDDVARVAGVSRATASRAVNGGAKVSARAQAAVDAAVSTLNYSPNPAARSLVTRRTDSIAVVVPEPEDRVFTDPFFAGTLRAVSRVLAEHELQMVLLLAPRGAVGDRTLRYLRGRHADGALVTSHHRQDRMAHRLAELGLPSVFCGRPWSGSNLVTYVDTDNVEGGRLAAEALLARGCRRIGTVAGPEDMTASVDRLEGWRAGLAAAGVLRDRVAHGDFTVAGGERATRALLEEHPDLDGLFVASDLMASGALNALRAAGRRVPQDVAVVGFDDLGVAEHTSPPLTTLRNPVAEMADQATRMLIQQIRGQSSAAPVRVVMPTALVVRESC